ncbi:hypothetical protein F4781DRAFT_56601 [Annulohypoxylon bovei var. microspora]|nr:hypothetical protein F4781DRAFT_56601 [Annulohypoxylon bovei var. microspora]
MLVSIFSIQHLLATFKSIELTSSRIHSQLLQFSIFTMGNHGTGMRNSNDMEHTHCNSHAFHAGTSSINGGFSHGVSGARYGLSATPDPTWRWNCCSCSGGGNQSYIYNSSCIECGHTRSRSCCVIYVSK